MEGFYGSYGTGLSANTPVSRDCVLCGLANVADVNGLCTSCATPRTLPNFDTSPRDAVLTHPIPPSFLTPRRYSEDEWETHRAQITRLYIAENRTLRTVIEVLRREHNFVASKSQLTNKLKIWSLRKNIPAFEKAFIVRKKEERLEEGKPTHFRIRERPVPTYKIARWLKQGENSINMGDIAKSPGPSTPSTPSDIRCYSPASIRSPSPQQPCTHELKQHLEPHFEGFQEPNYQESLHTRSPNLFTSPVNEFPEQAQSLENADTQHPRYEDGESREDVPTAQMVPFTFIWMQPAEEVYVTGTFDDWSKSVLLDKTGDLFTKEVLLSCSVEKTYYKFVVNGNWTINLTAAHEHDEYGNDINFITKDQLQSMASDRLWLSVTSYLDTRTGPRSREPADINADDSLRYSNISANIAAHVSLDTSGDVSDGVNPRLSNDQRQSETGETDMAVEQRTEEDFPDWDLRSLESLDTFGDSALGSSLPSAMSVSTLQGLPRTAQEEILIIIISDLELRSLFEEAAMKIDKSRFIRNIRRLFLLFQQDLQANRLDRRELDALRIIQRHSPWLASRLYDFCSPNSGSDTEVMARYLNQQLDKRPMLEKYLATMGAEPNQLNQNQSEENDSSSEEDIEESQNGQEHIDYSKFPNIERIKNFLVGGTAFENLKRSASHWIHPVYRVQPNTGAAVVESSASTKPSQLLQSSQSSESLSPKSSTISSSTKVTMPDADSDLSDGDSDLSYDPDLVDEAAEDRILAPKIHFDKLRLLEREVFVNSGIATYRNGASFSKTDDDQFICGSKSPASHADTIDAQFVLSLVMFTNSGMLLRLLECYDLMARIQSSLERFQEAGYCNTHFSILVKDGDRVGVAKLVQTEIQSILKLGTAVGSLLKNVISAVAAMQAGVANQENVKAIIEGQDDQIGLTSNCLKILHDIGLSPHLLLNDIRTIIWESTFQCLDLAILSYAGAHIQRFDLDHMGNDASSFTIPRRFEYHDQTLKALSSSPVTSVITMRRRQFQCLDKFLGGAEPWVFHQDFCNLSNQRLFLATTIGALSDIWGPSWRISRNSEPGRIQQVDIGNGAILPWPITPQHGESKLEVYPSEMFCHWMPFRDLDAAEVDGNQARLTRGYFVESDVLLVGATPEFGLVVNENCVPPAERLLSIKTKLDQQGALRTPNTSRARRYLDSHAVQVQASAIGFASASGTITYKRQKGQTMKDALVERWSHGSRNPMDLEAFSGVEISLCTRNARRRRLLHLLGSSTMHNYLRGISFVWISEACEYVYLKALRSPKHFRRFWRGLDPEQLENVGDAISKCLEALEETGIDDESRELRGLWVESFDTEGDSDGESDNDSDDGQKATPPPYTAIAQTRSNFFEEWIATLFRSEYTWTGFLEDSEESLTMAILGTTCLDFDHAGYGRRCSKPSLIPSASAKTCKGYPVLQTSLQVNTSLLNNSKLKPELVSNGQATVWNAKELKKGTTFCLGDHGSLKVLTAASRTCPVIMEWTGVKSEVVKEVKNVALNEKMLGRPKEKHHREHIRGKWAEKPLPVLVLSKSNKVTFSKE